MKHKEPKIVHHKGHKSPSKHSVHKTLGHHGGHMTVGHASEGMKNPHGVASKHTKHAAKMHSEMHESGQGMKSQGMKHHPKGHGAFLGKLHMPVHTHG
jgi:hypothetical protein